MKTWVMSCIWAVVLTMGAWASEGARTVSVVGEGQVALVPDMAILSLGVTHEDSSAKAAMDRVSGDVRALMAVLEEAGVAARDVQTEQLSVQPVWDRDNGARQITGYAARNSLSVRVRALEGLGAVLDAALNAGSNAFGGLRFQVQDSSAAEAEARAAAVADATRRARQMTDAAGVTLGPIVTMSEQGGGGRPEMFAAAWSADMPVAAGEVVVTARVAITFDLLP